MWVSEQLSTKEDLNKPLSIKNSNKVNAYSAYAKDTGKRLSTQM